LSSTNGLRLDKPKLFSLFANHSFSTVTLPTSVVKRSFCFCDLTSSSLYSRQQFKFSYFEQVKLNKKIGVKKMSKKRTKYTSAFKTKLVLELLQNQIKKEEIYRLNMKKQDWKKVIHKTSPIY
jgi:hypothetical protein